MTNLYDEKEFTIYLSNEWLLTMLQSSTVLSMKYEHIHQMITH